MTAVAAWVYLNKPVELLQGDAKIGLDCAIARRAEEEAESGHKMALAGHRLRTALTVLSVVRMPETTSTSFMFGTGLKKCMPMKCPGRLTKDASRVTDRPSPKR